MARALNVDRRRAARTILPLWRRLAASRACMMIIGRQRFQRLINEWPVLRPRRTWSNRLALRALFPDDDQRALTRRRAGRRGWALWSLRGAGIARNWRINPMPGKLPMHLSPRCGAHCRTTGEPCQQPAMANGRCRMHGGTNPGAPKGNRNAFKHGRYTAQAIANRREVAALIRAMRAVACAPGEMS